VHYYNETEGKCEKDSIIDNIKEIVGKSNNIVLCSILPTYIAKLFNKQAWNNIIVRLN